MTSKVEAEIERVNRLSSAALAEMVMQDAHLLRERAAGAYQLSLPSLGGRRSHQPLDFQLAPQRYHTSRAANAGSGDMQIAA